MQESRPPKQWFDRLALMLLAACGALGVFALLIAPHFFLPAEDAVILFQYSRNLAQTGAITYIPSGPHAEGATDFAWMALISLGMKFGANPYWIANGISAISLALLAMLLLRTAGQKIRALPVLAIMGAFALMPQIFAAASGFSALPFACLLALLVLCILEINDIAAPIVALLTCLFRPDGIIFTIPLLLSALSIYPRRARRLVFDILLFVAPGLIYFFWRWHYFGELFPLPFIVKSDTPRFAHLFVVASIKEARPFLFFAAFSLSPVLLEQMKNVRNRVVLLCIFVIPSFFYFAMRLDQNIGERFFIYIPMGVAILIAMNWQSVGLNKAITLRVVILAWLLCLCRGWIIEMKYFNFYQFDGLKTIAEQLSQTPKGKLVTTEAGILPYYSHWESYDAWGLNTPFLAHRLFQPSDVASINPDLILVHRFANLECTAQPDWNTPYKIRDWEHLTRNIVAGTDPARYELWILPFSTPRRSVPNQLTLSKQENFCWYVRRDSALRQQIDSILAQNHGTVLTQNDNPLPFERIPIIPPYAGNPAPRTLGLLRHYLSRVWEILSLLSSN